MVFPTPRFFKELVDGLKLSINLVYSSSTAFHTLISVAMLPYNQSFIVSFVCYCFSFAASQMCEKKGKKVEEKGGHFTVGERV